MNNPVLYILLLVTISLNAQQNLVYNGDFEEYDTCPTTISTPSDYQIEHCLGWNSPTYATSDYFNACASWPVSVPNNAFGTITPQSGDAYCGLLIANCTYPSCEGWWVEYIQCQLLQPLEANKIYEFSCYIALSNIYYQYSFSEFGVHLSSNAITSSTPKPFNLVPTNINPRGNFLTDTVYWDEYKSTFIASGGENYITLGFFIDTTNIDTLFSDPFFDPNNYSSYYYIDNCNLKESEASFPNIFTPNGDGLNDQWIPFNGFENVVVVNRWGNVVKSLVQGETWDGTDNNGKPLNDGVYYFNWYSNNLNKTGFIQLIR